MPNPRLTGAVETRLSERSWTGIAGAVPGTPAGMAAVVRWMMVSAVPTLFVPMMPQKLYDPIGTPVKGLPRKVVPAPVVSRS